MAISNTTSSRNTITVSPGLVDRSTDEIGRIVSDANRAIVETLRGHGKVIESSRPSMRFNMFNERGERSTIVKLSTALAEYMHENSLPTLLIIDARARASYLPFIHAWRKLYREEKRPDIYFVNPVGTIDQLEGEEGNIYTAVEEFLSGHRHLVAKRGKPVMVYDTCVHSGMTVRRVATLLRYADFKDVRLGLVDKSNAHNVEFVPSFVPENNPYFGCTLFGTSKMQLVERGLCVISFPSRIKEDVEDGILARRELSDMVDNGIEETGAL